MILGTANSPVAHATRKRSHDQVKTSSDTDTKKIYRVVGPYPTPTSNVADEDDLDDLCSLTSDDEQQEVEQVDRYSGIFSADQTEGVAQEEEIKDAIKIENAASSLTEGEVDEVIKEEVQELTTARTSEDLLVKVEEEEGTAILSADQLQEARNLETTVTPVSIQQIKVDDTDLDELVSDDGQEDTSNGDLVSENEQPDSGVDNTEEIIKEESAIALDDYDSDLTEQTEEVEEDADSQFEGEAAAKEDVEDEDEDEYVDDEYIGKSSSSKSKNKQQRVKSTKQIKGKARALASKSDRYEKTTLKPQNLLPVETTVDNYWVYLFFRFCAERHKMYERREFEGLPRNELTKDETMSKMHIGNIFRQLDPSSKKIRKDILGKGDQSHIEICFRLFLFCMFYKESTWEALCSVSTGGMPTWKHFIADLPAMERILYKLSILEKKRIYYGGFQIVPPNIYFSTAYRNRDSKMIHFASSLRLVISIMRAGLPDKLLNLNYALDASYILQTIPTLGGFLSWNIICFLNDSTSQFKWSFRNFATCGPGPRSYLQRIFGGKSVINNVIMEESGLLWLYENQWKYWNRFNENPPHAFQLGMKPGMRVLDFENSLCWCHRYVNEMERKGYGNFGQLPLPSIDKEQDELSHEPHWCEEFKNINSISKVIYKDDLEELKQREQHKHIEGKEEDCYEVEKVISRKDTRKGDQNKKDAMFRVRWKGYPPEEDTWEKSSMIKDGAAESLQDWIDWEDNVWNCIEKVKKEFPYVPPIIPKLEIVEIDSGSEAEDQVVRPNKRAKRVMKEEIE
ncbi:uncharacterized protein L201_004574 [Kwoniella dendrophila CBS 6074]|uniref:Chromo domain-containing protein n=1 Tax=Kwoniella dendrophila CBS 6074 TaxID=1295534 RepID=A0AAX4JXP5_9TREE